MGQGGSMILAQEAAHLFATARPNFYAVLDSHMQAIAAVPPDRPGTWYCIFPTPAPRRSC